MLCQTRHISIEQNCSRELKESRSTKLFKYLDKNNSSNLFAKNLGGDAFKKIF